MRISFRKLILACTVALPLALSAQGNPTTGDSLKKYVLSGWCFCESCLKEQNLHKDRVFQEVKEIKKPIAAKTSPMYKFKFVGNLLSSTNTLDTDQIYILKKVHFYGGVPVMKKEAYPELDTLILFLQQNPTVKILISGHVNAAGKNTPELQVLSQDRANAVMFYLIKHGKIEKSRLSAQGFGNTRQLFIVAINEFEMQANRRVEIQITAK